MHEDSLVIGNSLVVISHLATMKRLAGAVDNRLAGADASLVEGIRVADAHAHKLVIDGLSGHRVLGAVLRDGSGIQGGAGLEGESGPFGGAVVGHLGGEALGGTIAVGQDEFPGCLLRGTGDIELFILCARNIFFVLNMVDKRYTAVPAGKRHIDVGTSEIRFTEETLGDVIRNRPGLYALLHHIHDVMDLADVGIIVRPVVRREIDAETVRTTGQFGIHFDHLHLTGATVPAILVIAGDRPITEILHRSNVINLGHQRHKATFGRRRQQFLGNLFQGLQLQHFRTSGEAECCNQRNNGI